MFVIGLTGGVGTGKSTVAKMFANMGAEVLDADRITHRLMEPGTGVWKKIRGRFGREVMTPDGQIDRRKLGEVAFSSGPRLRLLCRIVHPAVRAQINGELARIRRRDLKAVVVLEIPLLFETEYRYKTDAVVVVSAPAAAAGRRLQRRSGWTLAEARKRSSFQMPLREKERRADFVVRNGGTISNTRRQVFRIWKKITGEGIHVRRKDDGRKDR